MNFNKLPAKIAARFRRTVRIFSPAFWHYADAAGLRECRHVVADLGYKTLRIHDPFVWDFRCRPALRNDRV